MLKVLFLIHDLGSGGAEKVLVNLVNRLNREIFDVTIVSLFGGGVNEKYLKEDVHYSYIWENAIPGNSKIMKIFSPELLHKMCVKDKYDIEIAYLEGPSSRVISGCTKKDTKLISWIHSNHFSEKEIASSYRNISELKECYSRFDKVVCVSQFMKENFTGWVPEVSDCCVVKYNVVETDDILIKSRENQKDINHDEYLNLVAVGTFKEVKAFDRLLRIIKRFKNEEKKVRLYLIGKGPLEKDFISFIEDNHLENEVKLLGYQDNPYKYVRDCDLFVCSSLSEGFSTAATEALIVGTPVCTVDVSGMKEMLGENNDYGVVTENNEDSLYEGIKGLLDDPEKLKYYREQAFLRGRDFSTENTVKAVEEMLINLWSGKNDYDIER